MAVSLAVKKKKIEADWARNMEVSACRTWHKYNEVDMEKKTIMVAFSDLKMVETSTEGVPQLFLLLVFTSASVLLPVLSGLGLVKDASSIYSYVFVTLSLVQTFITIISSILAAMNIRQDGQLGMKSKAILGLSITFQLGARLLLMVPTALMALPTPEEEKGKLTKLVYPPPDPSLTKVEASLLLTLPLLFHYISLLFLYVRLNITSFWALSFKDKMLHLLSNTWVSIPVRSPEGHQVHKSREQLWSVVFAGANLALTAFFTARHCQDRAARFPGVMGHLGLTWGESTSRNEFEFCAEGLPKPCYQVIVKAQVESSTEFLLLFGLPSLLCQVAGAGLLLLYYRTSHPWRALGREREARCWGRLQGTRQGVQVETPYWEQANMEVKEPANSGTEPVGLSWRQVPSSPVPQSLAVRVDSESIGIAEKKKQSRNASPASSSAQVPKKPYWQQKVKKPANSNTEPVGLSWRQVPSSPCTRSPEMRVDSGRAGVARRLGSYALSCAQALSSVLGKSEESPQHSLGESMDKDSIEEVRIEVELDEEGEKEAAGKLNSCLTLEEWNSRDEVMVLVESSEEVSALIHNFNLSCTFRRSTESAAILWTLLSLTMKTSLLRRLVFRRGNYNERLQLSHFVYSLK